MVAAAAAAIRRAMLEKHKKAGPVTDGRSVPSVAKKAAARTAHLAALPGKRRLSPEQRSQDFVKKAIEFFAEVGFDGGTRDLAKRLGVTQPLLYRYFPTKDDLIKEVYRVVYLNRWKPEWDALLQDRSLPLRERLERFYGDYTAAIFNREWMRIYMFSGLRGVQINKWYQQLVEERILKRICVELRHAFGLPEDVSLIGPDEMEVAWTLHGGIVYFGVREHIYDLPVPKDRAHLISTALDVFFEGGAETLRKSASRG